MKRAAALATSLTLVVVILAGLPLLTGSSDAFAAVQKHFPHCRNLTMHITQRMAGAVIQTSTTTIDDRGMVRTDIGSQMSIIVDPVAGRTLTLLHQPRQAMLAPLPKSAPAADQALDWLQELREFQGQATRLPVRQIDAQTAHGWRLDLGAAGPLTLRADDQGLPLSMQLSSSSQLQIDYSFRFNTEIPAGRLSSEIPEGYAAVSGEDR